MLKSIIAAIRANWRSYTFVPSGEAVRALEIAVVTAGLQVAWAMDWTKTEDIGTYLKAIFAAAVVAGLGYVKGKVPAA